MNTVLLPIDEYIDRLETADNTTKNAIENELVNIGKEAVPSLVESLQIVKGKTRGIVAMVLIRIGESSIDYLKKAAANNHDFEWIANYLITEIKGVAA